MIYADNAATTRIDPDALEIMQKYLADEYGNASSLYSFAREGKKVLAEARSTIAECIGAAPDEIYFTSGGSEADNQAIVSAARIGEKKGKKHIMRDFSELAQTQQQAQDAKKVA